MLGDTHPDTVNSMNDLADLYEEARCWRDEDDEDVHCLNYEAAEPLYSEALQLRRETLGHRHPNTLASIGNLALFYNRRDRFDETKALYAQAVEAYMAETVRVRGETTLGDTDLAILISLTKNVFTKMFEYSPLLTQLREEKIDELRGWSYGGLWGTKKYWKVAEHSDT